MVIAVDLPLKSENIASHRVESDVMDIDFVLEWTRLVGTFEVPSDLIAVLCDLDMFYLDLLVPDLVE